MSRLKISAVAGAAVIAMSCLIGLPHLQFGGGAAEAASRRVCKDGHFHSGESAWRATKAQAEAEAIADYTGFTALEYGAAWGNFNAGLARSKTCTKSGDGLTWHCLVQAVPCIGPAARPLQVRAQRSSKPRRSSKSKAAGQSGDWSLW